MPPNTAATDWLAGPSRDPLRRGRAGRSAARVPLRERGPPADHVPLGSAPAARPLRRPRRDAHRAFTWQQLRNRTAVALQLGGGLAPGDVRALNLLAPGLGGRPRPRPAVEGGGAGQRQPAAARNADSAVGGASCSSTGCRSARRRASPASISFPRPSAASRGARKRTTRRPRRCSKTPGSMPRKAALSSCAHLRAAPVAPRHAGRRGCAVAGRRPRGHGQVQPRDRRARRRGLSAPPAERPAWPIANTTGAKPFVQAIAARAHGFHGNFRRRMAAMAHARRRPQVRLFFHKNHRGLDATEMPIEYLLEIEHAPFPFG
jgi:hypothetical protein